MVEVNLENIRPISDSVSADDTDVMARIFCTGRRSDATTYADPEAVITNGGTDAVTLWRDAANSTYEVLFAPAAATPGLLALATDIAADYTYGELQDLVNAATGWEMILVGALRADDVYTHSGTVVNAIGNTKTSTAAGYAADDTGTPFLADTSVVDISSLCLGMESLSAAEAGTGSTRRMDNSESTNPDRFDPITVGANDSTVPSVNISAPVESGVNRQVVMTSYSCSATTATSSTITIYAGKQGATERIVYGPILGPTGGNTISNPTDFPEKPLLPGERAILRLTGANDLATPIMSFAGYMGVAIP